MLLYVRPLFSALCLLGMTCYLMLTRTEDDPRSRHPARQVLQQDELYSNAISEYNYNSEEDSDGEYRDYYFPPCKCSRLYVTADILVSSQCGPFSSLRGPSQKVVSYSFYGNTSSVFFKGVQENADRIRKYYPGWVMRVYHDIKISDLEGAIKGHVCDVMCNNDHVDFCDVTELPELGNVSHLFGMIWRFLVLGDPLVERFLVRDLDSLVGPREVAAVQEWIQSNKTFHGMRDSPMHNTLILGGMWGAVNHPLEYTQNLRDKIIHVSEWSYKGYDQKVLDLVLGPEVNKSAVFHDSFFCREYPWTRAFPTRREPDGEFVGSPSLLYPNVKIRQECPSACRPQGHKDWRFC